MLCYIISHYLFLPYIVLFFIMLCYVRMKRQVAVKYTTQQTGQAHLQHHQRTFFAVKEYS
jgi:hypothetical protein